MGIKQLEQLQCGKLRGKTRLQSLVVRMNHTRHRHESSHAAECGVEKQDYGERLGVSPPCEFLRR